ncbi:Tesmin/TSO1-like CXC domain protein [Nitzschia inconspicua]|uniref:Tesmin/TSO1-like CXC domain protein n=1 Tax=Nitzschia inconspicua TaxID=303405 RepID=A0A9K3LFJ7_9STRA|nr:Tesmin/TSO1-like CXC domain protein [Nitzschia inconspicua]
MESVSSCSPGVSTSSASAAGTSFVQEPSAIKAHRVNPEERRLEATNSIAFGTGSMPHTTDERRDDTYLHAPGGGRTRWSHVIKTSPPSNTITRYKEQNQHMASYESYFTMAPVPWSQELAPSDHWRSHGARAVAPRTSFIPYRFATGMFRSSTDYDRTSIPWQHSNSFFSRPEGFNNYDQQTRQKIADRHPVAVFEKQKSVLIDVSRHKSTVVIPRNVLIPKELRQNDTNTDSPTEGSIGKRSTDASNRSESSPIPKRSKGEQMEGHFDKLDLLCSATLELGPLQENPSGCSCPKSKCVALYCDCFKAGRRCNPSSCSCLNCKNTVEESGPDGARSKAIQAILTRNPRAFTNPGNSSANKLPPGEQACNCIRSRCLKLYCTCFQKRKACDPSICTCVGCLNTEDDSSGMRQIAIETTLEKRPDAFKQKSKTKILGAGCACKNNQW